MTNAELYVNLIKEAGYNIEKAKELLSATVCEECRKDKYKRGCRSCRIKRFKKYLGKLDYCELIKKCMYNAIDLFGTEANGTVDDALIEKLNEVAHKKMAQRRKITEFGIMLNTEDDDYE